jgi:hypothetical protein
MKAFASLATSSGGGSSATKWRASFCATRRRRMMGQVGEHCAALIGSALGVKLAEHCLLARLVQALVEQKLAAMRGVGCVGRRPAGQHLGEIRHVGLRIAAADTERVEFENFTGEILVQPFVAVDARNRVGAHRADIVEVIKHRRMAFDGDQHVGEAPKHVGADRLALVGADHGDIFVGRDAEMIRPEPNQAFDETDVGAGGCLVACSRFVLENLLRQRRF